MCVVILLIASISFSLADPPKKTVDSDKLAKECADSYFKAILNRKADDALRLCGIPFYENGEISETALDDLKKDIERGVPPGLVIKAGDQFTLDKFNDWLDKNHSKKLDAELLKKYGEILGVEGRIVLTEITLQGKRPPTLDQPHLLIRIREGKAQIVGTGQR